MEEGLRKTKPPEEKDGRDKRRDKRHEWKDGRKRREDMESKKGTKCMQKMQEKKERDEERGKIEKERKQ